VDAAAFAPETGFQGGGERFSADGVTGESKAFELLTTN
jgi:hypothetical protein